MHIGEITEEYQPADEPGDATGEPNLEAHLHTGLEQSKGFEQTEPGVTWLVSVHYYENYIWKTHQNNV